MKKNNLDLNSRKNHGIARTPSGYEEKVVEVKRVSRTVKGGRRIRFRALVVVGNRRGKVGMGIGKASEVATAVKTASEYARRHLIEVEIKNDTIPHEVEVSHAGAKLIIKPAGPGTSVIAGGSVRAVIELAGYKNILSKILGTNNKINNVKATLVALKNFKKPTENI
jgi:small subunit ribosomal protein S5